MFPKNPDFKLNDEVEHHCIIMGREDDIAKSFNISVDERRSYLIVIHGVVVCVLCEVIKMLL